MRACVLLLHSVSHATIAFSKRLLHGYSEFCLVVYSCTTVIFMTLDLAMVFLGVKPEVQATEGKIDKLDVIKIKNLCAPEDTIKKWKTTIEWEKIFANNLTGKSSVSRIHKDCYNSTIKRQIIQPKMGKGSESTFLQRCTMTIKSTERCSTSLATKGIQIKIRVSCHFCRMARIKKDRQCQYGQRCEAIRTLAHR